MVLIHRNKYIVDKIDRKEIIYKLIQDIINEHKNDISEINRIYGIILQESINIDRDKQTTNENDIISIYNEYIPLAMYLTPILCCIIYTMFF